MTEAVTHRRILAIALPIVLSNVTVPLLGLVDTGVIGQLGEAAPIGGVGIGAVILTTVYWIFGFLRMGTTGLTAQAHGAGDTAEEAALLLRGLAIAGIAGLLLIAGQAAVFSAAFRLAPASAEVEAFARAYLEIRIWGAPATIALYAINGWLIAMERTRAVLALQVLMNGLNILLSILFVLGFGWGVEGIAISTLIAEFTGLAFGLWLCRAVFAGGIAGRAGQVFDAARLRHMAAVNRDILLRSIMLQASTTSFLFLGAGLGDVTLAANQVLLQFLSVTAYALDGIAFAAEALVGGTVGARALAALRRAVRLSVIWGAGFAVALSLGFLAIGPWAIDIMTTAPDVRAAARDYLPWMVAAPLAGVGAFLLDGIFIGATRTREMRNAMVLSVAVYVAALLALVPVFGNHGLWASLLLLYVVRAVTLALRYPAVEAAAVPDARPCR